MGLWLDPSFQCLGLAGRGQSQATPHVSVLPSLLKNTMPSSGEDRQSRPSLHKRTVGQERYLSMGVFYGGLHWKPELREMGLPL